MIKQDFINSIVNIGYEYQEGILFRKVTDDIKSEVRFMSYDGIEKGEWDEIKKGIPDLTHMTRIVGYYSKVHNWNRSKIGELRDRQKGDYGTGTPQAERAKESQAEQTTDETSEKAQE